MFSSDVFEGRNIQYIKRLFVFSAAISGAIAIGAIAAQQLLLAIAATAVILMSIAVLIWPDAVTFVVVFLIFTNTAVIAVKYHNVPFVVGASVPLLLAFPLLYKLIIQRQKIVFNSSVFLLLIYLAIQSIGVLFSRITSVSFDSWVTFVTEGLILYFLVINVVRSPLVLKQVVWVLLAAGAFIGTISIYQQVTNTFHNDYWGFAQVDTGFGTGVETIEGEVVQPRLAGPLGEKNYYAQVMLMLVPLGLFQFLGEKSGLCKLLAIVFTGVILFGALLTFSRGGAIGFIILVVVMIFMRYIKPQHALVFLLCLALLISMTPQLRTRLSSLQALTSLLNEDSAGVAGTDRSIQGRLGEMVAAGLVFADHPIAGVGPGMFKYYYQEYAEIAGLRLHTGTREAHNLFLDIGAESGIIGLSCFLGLLFITLGNLHRTRNYFLVRRPELAMMATGLLLAIISYLASGLFLTMAYTRYFWLMMALADVAGRLVKANRHPSLKTITDALD